MMDFKFLHAADIHLDSPLRGLARYEGVPADMVRTATRQALDNLVAFAIEEKVAFLVIAGDLYDGDWDAFATGLFFCAAMGRLQRAGIAVYIVLGNHDAESNMTRQLPLPDNVKVFSSRKPESLVHEATGTVLHGQSYRTRDPGGDLAAQYPAARVGGLNIGVLHTALTGGRGPHAPYAPCTPEQLAAKGYDYWALGHVHAFERVTEDPLIIFPGNLQGRHIRETGPKGAVLVNVSAGEINSAEHVALDVVRWAKVAVDLTGVTAEAEAYDRIRRTLEKTVGLTADGRPLVARLALEGVTVLHDRLAADDAQLREELRAICAALSDQLWLEKIVHTTRQPAAEGQRAGPGDLEGLLADLAGAPEVAAELAADLAEFLAKAPADLDDELDLLPQVRAGDLKGLLGDAAGALRARLAGGAGQ